VAERGRVIGAVLGEARVRAEPVPARHAAGGGGDELRGAFRPAEAAVVFRRVQAQLAILRPARDRGLERGEALRRAIEGFAGLKQRAHGLARLRAEPRVALPQQLEAALDLMGVPA